MNNLRASSRAFRASIDERVVDKCVDAIASLTRSAVALESVFSHGSSRSHTYRSLIIHARPWRLAFAEDIPITCVGSADTVGINNGRLAFDNCLKDYSELKLLNKCL